MRLLKKIIPLVFIFTMFFKSNSIVEAYPTPIFDSLTPNLKEIMRLYGENFLSDCSINKTPEEVAERRLNKEYVEINGTLYHGHGGPMKLTNQDIESLYNLPNVKQLDLEWFNLREVDINKFLGINNNKTIEMVILNSCRFDTWEEEQVVARITQKEYTVGIHPCIWIAWPGVNPDDIFLGR